MRTAIRLVIGLLSAVSAVGWSAAAFAQTPSDAEIRAILVDHVDRIHDTVGIVVGVIDASGRRIVAYGAHDRGDGRPVGGDTVFEIGSISKVFTSLLLATAVERGDVALDDPVARFLPAGTPVPEHNGRAITLRQLSQHDSGLPEFPSNVRPKDPANPFADYTVEQMYQFLSGYVLTRDPGSQYAYSSLGAGLLGNALARRAGSDYESLLKTRVLTPLNLTSTSITLTASQQSRLAPGHNGDLDRVPNQDLPTLAGAGAIRSTANDMLTFLATNMGLSRSPLSAAMGAMLAPRRPTTTPDMEIGLGWHFFTTGGRELVWHNGATAGYHSFAAFDPKARVGVVVLANTATATIDMIGRHLIDPATPLKPVRVPATIDTAVYQRLAGQYRLSPVVAIGVATHDGRAFITLTGQQPLEIYPSSETEYFLRAVDAQLTFERNAEGRAIAVTLHQNGRNLRALRIE